MEEYIESKTRQNFEDFAGLTSTPKRYQKNSSLTDELNKLSSSPGINHAGMTSSPSLQNKSSTSNNSAALGFHKRSASSPLLHPGRLGHHESLMKCVSIGVNNGAAVPILQSPLLRLARQHCMNQASARNRSSASSSSRLAQRQHAQSFVNITTLPSTPSPSLLHSQRVKERKQRYKGSKKQPSLPTLQQETSTFDSMRMSSSINEIPSCLEESSSSTSCDKLFTTSQSYHVGESSTRQRPRSADYSSSRIIGSKNSIVGVDIRESSPPLRSCSSSNTTSPVHVKTGGGVPFISTLPPIAHSPLPPATPNSTSPYPPSSPSAPNISHAMGDTLFPPPNALGPPTDNSRLSANQTHANSRVDAAKSGETDFQVDTITNSYISITQNHSLLCTVSPSIIDSNSFDREALTLNANQVVPPAVSESSLFVSLPATNACCEPSSQHLGGLGVVVSTMPPLSSVSTSTSDTPLCANYNSSSCCNSASVLTSVGKESINRQPASCSGGVGTHYQAMIPSLNPECCNFGDSQRDDAREKPLTVAVTVEPEDKDMVAVSWASLASNATLANPLTRALYMCHTSSNSVVNSQCESSCVSSLEHSGNELPSSSISRGYTEPYHVSFSATSKYYNNDVNWSESQGIASTQASYVHDIGISDSNKQTSSAIFSIENGTDSSNDEGKIVSRLAYTSSSDVSNLSLEEKLASFQRSADRISAFQKNLLGHELPSGFDCSPVASPNLSLRSAQKEDLSKIRTSPLMSYPKASTSDSLTMKNKPTSMGDSLFSCHSHLNTKSPSNIRTSPLYRNKLSTKVIPEITTTNVANTVRHSSSINFNSGACDFIDRNDDQRTSKSMYCAYNTGHGGLTTAAAQPNAADRANNSASSTLPVHACASSVSSHKTRAKSTGNIASLQDVFNYSSTNSIENNRRFSTASPSASDAENLFNNNNNDTSNNKNNNNVEGRQ